MNKEIMKLAGFGKEVETVEAGKCPLCAKAIVMSEFEDALSRREFGISGICQKCQNDVFAPPKD